MPEAEKRRRDGHAASTSDPIELAPADHDIGRRGCPSCGRLVHADSRQCAYCGFHLDRGLGVTPATEGASTRPDIPCRKCGYDLFGNTSGVCPECGTRVSRSKRELLADSGEIARFAYIRPLIAGLIGVVFVPIWVQEPARYDVCMLAILLAFFAGAVVHMLSALFIFHTGESPSLNAAQGAGLCLFVLALMAWLFPLPAFGTWVLIRMVLVIILATAAAMSVFDENDEQDAALTMVPVVFAAIGSLELAAFLAR
jgi:RNA polymerase subunit RPABC4/transcription elongation factor Spt4